MSEQLQEAIQRVVSGSRHEVDIQTIAAALQAGQLTLVPGDGAIGVSRDATNAILVTGSNNIIVQGEVAESLQAILERFSLNSPKVIASVDELVKQVRLCLHDDIQRLHGTMPLWGVDHWVPLGELFVDVNILEKLSSSHRAELHDLWQDFTNGMQEYSSYRSLDRIGLGKERQRISALEVLTKNRNLMVVGKPGSGKTTYLQRVVTECNAGNLQVHRIPVLIKLREFVEDGRSLSYSLERYLERYWYISAAETQLVLNQGRSLVLLDGLDEVTGEDGKTITKQIKQFARAYPQVQIVVTCRIQSQESRFERFDYVEVADFNEAQVQSFAEHWFKTVMQDEAAGLAKSSEFLKQLFGEENIPIRELAITPILLSLTCAVFYQTGKFYSKQSQLYEEGLELLLEQWDKSREIERDEVYRDLSVERKLELLSYLAVKRFEQEQYVLFDQAEIERYIADFLQIGQRESKMVLRAIESQHGFLIERAKSIWSFSHLTFQEYFVAKWIFSALTTSTPNLETIKYISEHIFKSSWNQIFLLVTDMSWNDTLLIQLHQYIDIIKLSIPYDKLQSFLTWLSYKSLLVQGIYELSAVRAFYFACALRYDNPCDLAYLLDRNFGYPKDFNTVLDLALISGAKLNFLITNYIGGSEASLAFERAFILALNRASQDCASGFINEVITELNYDLDFILNRNFSANLKPFLYKLKEQLPEAEDSVQANNWWKSTREIWLKALKDVLLRYRNMNHQWQFTKEDKCLLQQYYNANKLLIHCLNNSSDLSDAVRSIKEKLLLPMAEIEKCNHEKLE